MNADDLEHIRADVHQAILEAQRHDQTVTLEILWRLFDQVGQLATGQTGEWWATADEPHWWAEQLLQVVQLRAISKVPFADLNDVFNQAPEPEDHRDQRDG